MAKVRKKSGAKPSRKLPIEHTDFYPYLNEFLEYRLIQNYAKSADRRNDSNIRQFIVWCELRGIESPAAVTRPILVRYKKHLYYRRKKDGEPLSFQTQASQLSSLKRFFKWLARENHILYNPASDLELPKVPQQIPRHILSVEEVRDLLNISKVYTAEGLRDRAVMELLYSCGLRRQECANLSLRDVNLQQQTVLVREGKGGKDRMLPIGESACAWLDKYLIESRPELIAQETDVFFISNRGEACTGDGIGKLVKVAMKKANIDKPGSAHLLRHAMATHMLDNGADIRYIQVMLGHSSLRSTQVYTHVSVEKLRAIHRKTHPSKTSPEAHELDWLNDD